VEEVCGGERHVDVARLADRLAAVERLHDRQLAGALLDQARDAEQVLPALQPRQRRPARLGAVGGVDGAAEVAGPGERHLGHRLLGRWVERRHARAVERLAEVAVDEQPVGVAEPDVLGRLGRGRVIPDDARAGARHSFEKSSGRA
jgi:hypothetical protein